jgi:hypothetical protein
MAEAMAASADKVAWLEGALHGNLGNLNSKAADEGGRKVKARRYGSAGFESRIRSAQHHPNVSAS